MENAPPPLGSSITETITRHGITRHALSQQAGIPYTTLTRKLEGHADFTIRELGNIAATLGITLGELIPTEILDAA